MNRSFNRRDLLQIGPGAAALSTLGLEASIKNFLVYQGPYTEGGGGNSGTATAKASMTAD